MKDRGTVLVVYLGTLLSMLLLFFVVVQLGLAQTRALLNQLVAIQMTQLGYQNIKSSNPDVVFGPMTMVADLYGDYPAQSTSTTAPVAGAQTLPNGMRINISKTSSKPGSCEAIVTSQETMLSGMMNVFFPIDTGAKSQAIGNATYLSLLFDMSSSLVTDYSIIQQLAAAGIAWRQNAPYDETTNPTPDIEEQKRLPFAFLGWHPEPVPDLADKDYPSPYTSAIAQYWDTTVGTIEGEGANPGLPWMYPWEYGSTAWPTPTPNPNCTGGNEMVCEYNLPVGQAAHLWNLETDNFKAIKQADQYALLALSPIFDRVDLSTVSAASAWGNVRAVGDTTNATAIRGVWPIFKHEWGDILNTGVTSSQVMTTLVPNFNGSAPVNITMSTNVWTNQMEYAWMQQAPLWDQGTIYGKAFWAPTDVPGTDGVPSVKELYTPLWHDRCAVWNPDWNHPVTSPPASVTPFPPYYAWTEPIQPTNATSGKPFWMNRYPVDAFVSPYDNSDKTTRAVCMLAAIGVQAGGTDTAAGLKYAKGRCAALQAGYSYVSSSGLVSLDPTQYQCVTVLITDGLPESGSVPNPPGWSTYGYESYSMTFEEQMAEIDTALEDYKNMRGLVFTLFTEPFNFSDQQLLERQQFLDKMNNPDEGRYLIAIKTSPPVDLATTQANEQTILNAVKALVALVLRIPKIVMGDLN